MREGYSITVEIKECFTVVTIRAAKNIKTATNAQDFQSNRNRWLSRVIPVRVEKYKRSLSGSRLPTSNQKKALGVRFSPPANHGRASEVTSHSLANHLGASGVTPASPTNHKRASRARAKMWILHNTQEIEAPMLGGGEDDPSRRGPLEFITNMFKRRRDHDPHDDPRPPDITLREPEEMSETWTKEPMVGARSSDLDVTSSSEAVIGGSDTMASLESMTSSNENLIGGSAIMHHTPVKSRDIGIDMEAIRLSRQDNPYLQRVAGSQTTLNEDDDAGDCISASQPEDLAQLVTQSGVQQEPALSLSEVHEHLIRSPPPTSLPKTITKNMFVFPLSKAAEDDDALGAQMSNSVPCRTHSLNPLVARGHEDVLDQHLRQILNTQRQLVVSKGGRAGPGMKSEGGLATTSSSLSLPIRYPHQPASSSTLIDTT